MKTGLALLVAGLLLMGCAVDREKAVQGKWSSTPKDGAATALGVGISAMTGNGAAAEQTLAKALIQVSLDVRPDKTFSLVWDGAERTGNWTFDKQTGDLNLNVTQVKPLNSSPPPQNIQPETWTSTLDKNNKQLNFFPGNAQVADFLKKSGGPMASGFPLVKQGG